MEYKLARGEYTLMVASTSEEVGLLTSFVL